MRLKYLNYRNIFIIFVFVLIFFIFKNSFNDRNKRILHFNNNLVKIENAVSDSLFHFDIFLYNNSKVKQLYYISSTCGCMILSDTEREINSNQIDTISITINTYGKDHDYTSYIYLFNENRELLDTVLVDIKGFNKIK